MNQGRAITAAALLSVSACGGSDAPGRGEPNLIGDAQSAADTLTATLIQNQRELVRALVQDDSAALARMVSSRFVAHDTREVRPTPRALNGAPGPLQIAYFEVMGGALQDRVDSVYDTYHAVHDGDHATVFALGIQDAIRASWQRNESGWIATQFILIVAEDARRMIASDG